MDIINKYNKNFKVFFKNNLEFILDKKSNFIIFNLYIILLIIKVILILKKYNYKKKLFVAYNINYFKIVFILPIKVILCYIKVFII